MLAHALVGPPSRGLPQRWKPVVRSRVDRRLRSSRRQIPVCRYFRWSVLAMGIPRDFRFCIDRGGTFTDVYAEVPAQDAEGNTSVSFRTLKLLSEDPANYESAPREGDTSHPRGGDGHFHPARCPRAHRPHRVDTHGHDGRDERASGARGRPIRARGHRRVS